MTAAPIEKPEAVPLATVKALALRELHKFPEFNGAAPTNPTPLHFPDGRLAAYEFRMVKNGKTIGYIIVSANRNLPPAILEAGFGEKTPSDLMKELAARKGVKNYRLAYFGGLSYGLLTGDTVVNMKGREYKKPRKYTLSLEVEASRNQKGWKSIESTVLTTPKYPITPLATITSEKIIYGVPAWTSTDDGNTEDGRTPKNLIITPSSEWTYIGPAPDPWNKWDGCAPIAASMVIAYYEPQYTTEWYREAIIDDLHILMNTNDADGRTHAQDIAPGIEGFYQWVMTYRYPEYYSIPPKYSYDVTWYPDLPPNQLFSILKNEVDNNRPGILRTIDAIFESSGRVYEPHATTFVGYRTYSDGRKYVYIHTTWAPSLNGKPTTDWVLVGNWNRGDLYIIEPICMVGACPLSIGGIISGK